MSLLQPQDTQSRPTIHGTSRKRSSLFKKILHRRGASGRPMMTMNNPTAHSSSRHSPPYFNHRTRRVSNSPASSNLMQWLQSDCPQDLLPRILCFCGPQMTATLSRTNRYWHDIISREDTWQTLCEELYKVCI